MTYEILLQYLYVSQHHQLIHHKFMMRKKECFFHSYSVSQHHQLIHHKFMMRKKECFFHSYSVSIAH